MIDESKVAEFVKFAEEIGLRVDHKEDRVYLSDIYIEGDVHNGVYLSLMYGGVEIMADIGRRSSLPLLPHFVNAVSPMCMDERARRDIADAIGEGNYEMAITLAHTCCAAVNPNDRHAMSMLEKRRSR